MTKQQRKTIEREFYNYTKNRSQAAEYVASHAFDHFGVDYTSERVRSSSGNSPEQKVIRAIDQADRMWRWCLVFEKTLERFRWTGKDKLMEMRYIGRLDEYQICFKVHIERRTFFYWLDEILQVGFMWVKELKLNI